MFVHYCGDDYFFFRIYMSNLSKIFMILVLSACTKSAQKPVNPEWKKDSFVRKEAVIMGLSPQAVQNMKEQVLEMNAEGRSVAIEGENLVIVSGLESDLANLEMASGESATILENESVEIISNVSAAEITEEGSLIAKRDMNIDVLQSQFPTYDGRGIAVGIIDDGVSPRHAGFRTTSEGNLKFLDKEANGNFGSFNLLPLEEGNEAEKNFANYFIDLGFQIEGVGTVDEDPLKDDNGQDVNRSFTYDDKFSFVFISKEGSPKLVCLDLNLDTIGSLNECVGLFSETNGFLTWNETDDRAITVSYDARRSKIRFDFGEGNFSGHGDSVATIIAGHQIAGRYDGIAPGAQILDYDLNGLDVGLPQGNFSIGTFLKALTWLGRKGAKVVNISYSFFFHSVESQYAMKDALETLIEEYQFLIVFSAGNNGPGLTSYNRGLIYPDRSIVAGAHLSQEAAESIYGITGIPIEGIPAYYSSVGPSPDGGKSPDVLGPIADFVYDTFGSGPTRFDGTSSAAPSVAGLATVIMSGLQQLSLPIELRSLVSAIKLSSHSLKNTPYITQGFGLPQADQVIDLYKNIIEGRSFVTTNMVGKGTGLFKVLQNEDPIQVEIAVKPAVSSLLGLNQVNELISRYKIEYSHEWISGPRNTVSSFNGTSFSVLIEPQLLLSSQQHEFFGEIRLRDGQTNRIVSIYPVTLVKPIEFSGKPYTEDISLLPHEAKRFFLWASPGVKGFKVSYSFQNENIDTLVKTYDPSGVGEPKSFGETTKVFTMETNTPGLYQVAFFRKSGTKLPDVGKVEIAPIDVEILENDSTLDADGIEVALQSNFNSGEWLVTYEQPNPRIWKGSFSDRGYQNKEFRISIDQDVPGGNYEFIFSLKRRSPHRYYDPDCSLRLYKNNNFFKFYSKENIFIAGGLKIGDYFDVTCQLFENGVEESIQEIRYTAELNRKVTDEFSRTNEKIDMGFNYWFKGFANDWGGANIYIAPIENPNSRMQIGRIFR